MKAWVITWDWIGDHAAVKNPLIAIFSSRKTDKWISEYVENFYLSITCTAEEMAFYANRRNKLPYKAISPMIINNIPHGNRMICGYNTWLYARIVTDLQIKSDDENDLEIISWREPPIFKWKDEKSIEIEVSQEGKEKILKRRQGVLLQVNGILNI